MGWYIGLALFLAADDRIIVTSPEPQPERQSFAGLDCSRYAELRGQQVYGIVHTWKVDPVGDRFRVEVIVGFRRNMFSDAPRTKVLAQSGGTKGKLQERDVIVNCYFLVDASTAFGLRGAASLPAFGSGTPSGPNFKPVQNYPITAEIVDARGESTGGIDKLNLLLKNVDARTWKSVDGPVTFPDLPRPKKQRRSR